MGLPSAAPKSRIAAEDIATSTTRHRLFERFLASASPLLARDHGAELAADVVRGARVEYERVLPDLPDIGGWSNAFQPVMIVNAWLVALFRAMKARGLQAADTVRVAQEVSDAWLRRIPAPLLALVGRLAFSGLSRRYFAAQAERSQQRRYAADFVWRLEQSSDGEMAMVFDECAVHKWYAAQDTPELAPYCNFFDVTYSRLMGMGVDASRTIGTGCETCALRFRHGRETPVPENLRGILDARGARAEEAQP